MSEDNERCPDYFQDPYEKACEEISREAHKMMKEVDPWHKKVFAWAAAWLGQYEETNDNEEMPEIPTENLMLRHLIQIEGINLLILKELKKLNGKNKKL